MRFLLYKNLNTIKFENHEWFLLPSFSFSKEKRGLIHATHAGAACGSCGFGFLDVNDESFGGEHGSRNGSRVLECASGNLGRVDDSRLVHILVAVITCVVALENAASIASMFLTTECVLAEKKEDNPLPGMPAGAGMGGMM